MTKLLSLATLTLWVALTAGASRMSSEITALETWMITLHAFGRTAALTDRSLPALGSNERIFIDSRGCATTSEQRKKLIIFSQMIDRCSSLFVYTEVPSHQPILTTGCSLQTSSSTHTEHRGDLPGLRTRLDFTLLAQDSELADKYNVTISNAFAALKD